LRPASSIKSLVGDVVSEVGEGGRAHE
jgi:hypothetical protein